VAGIDEVGRGCLAGPVVAGAVILPASFERGRPGLEWLAEVADSKLVDPSTRERLAPLIEGWVADFALGVASVEEIDRINIHHASHLAMERAIRALRLRPERALVDGKHVPKGLGCPTTAVVKGDQLCLSVACASILAKVWRDRRMRELDALHPGYGFAAHKGYFTPEHQEALRRLGPCAIHRRSFSPVSGAPGLQDLQDAFVF
jgi:ribonuclease HII